jgi:hypothetical protein
VSENPLVRRQRIILADTIERLQLPLNAVLAPEPPTTVSWRVRRIEHDAVQAALERSREGALPGSPASSIAAIVGLIRNPKSLPTTNQAIA